MVGKPPHRSYRHKKEKSIMTDSEIKKGLKDAFVQLNEVKEGKRKTKNVKELLNEL